MADDKKSPVKPISREPRFSKLRGMKCFDEIHQKVCEGYPVPEIARIIQEERGEYTDVTRETLSTTLKEYRLSLPPAELVAQRMPPVFQKAAQQVSKGLDELKALEDLYELQMKRIKIDFEVEEKIQKLVPTMTQEIRVAREILQTYADLKMDLGLSKRHLGQLDVDTKLIADVANKYANPSVSKVIQDPGSRRKVVSLAEKLVQLAALPPGPNEPSEPPAAEQVVDMSPVPDEGIDPEDDATPPETVIDAEVKAVE